MFELDLLAQRVKVIQPDPRVPTSVLVDEMPVTDYLKRYHPDDIERIKFALRSCERDGVETEVEVRPISDKPDQWCKLSFKPIFTKGLVRKIAAIEHDYTEQKRQRLLFQESESRFKAIFNQTFHFIGLLSPDGTLIEANETAINFGGISPEEVSGKKFWETPWWSKEPKIKEQLRQQVMRAAQGALVRYETEMYGKGTYTVTVELTIRPVKNEQGKVIYLIPEARDVTDKKEVLEQLIALNRELELKIKERTRELEEMNEDLEAFAHSVSHDLRTPLRAIRGFLLILKESLVSPQNEEQIKLVEKIEASADKMSRLINDLLRFCKTAQTKADFGPVDLDSLFREVAEELKATYPNTRIELEKLPQVYGDERMLRQVAVNLLGNACKYSSRSEHPLVKVSVSDDNIKHTITVEDNGVGFNPEMADGLFEVFQRLHTDGEFEGTGVGLSIVKKIIEKHKGNIWAEAEVQKGAAFSFTLPKDKTKAEIHELS
ncbi:MAG: hypothetical protein Kow0075_00280 [Salibacteraceae bacterium]